MTSRPICTSPKIQDRHSSRRFNDLIIALVSFVLIAVAGCSEEGKSKPESSQATKLAWFDDRREKLGIEAIFHSGFDDTFLLPEIVGGGGALFDLDNDNDLDLYFVGGGSLAKPLETVENRLFRNDGPAGFVDITESSGLNQGIYGMGVAAFDFDRDGWTDLFVTSVGRAILFRNLGNGTFEDVSTKAGIDVPGWSTSAAALDVNQDGWLDLYVCCYVEWTVETDIACFKPSGARDYCNPTSYNKPAQDLLLVNNGDGTFSNRTIDSGIIRDRGNGLGVVPCDFDNDGDRDLFVANDMTPDILWINDGEGNFVNQAMAAGCAVDRDGAAKAGMGTCIGDLNFDGLMDLVVVNLASQSDSFFENRGAFFVDRTTQKGLALESRAMTRFGVGWQDFDNDGYLDMFLANGRVTLRDNTSMEDSDPFAEKNIVMNGEADGKFSRLSPDLEGDVANEATSRAAIFGDLNNDGRIDVVVVNKDSQCEVLMNTVPNAGNWAAFDVRDSSGLIAVGAIVRMQTPPGTTRRDVNPHYSYLASNDHRVHFGLGDQISTGDVEVHWPGGQRELFGPFEANGYQTLREGEGRTITSAGQER